jgi:acetolactate synthase-1/2/3 large subunit
VATPETVGQIVAETFKTAGPVVVVLPTVLHMFAATHILTS